MGIGADSTARGTWSAGVVVAVVAAVGLGGSLLVACGGSSTSTPSAAQLRALNPAARLGGHTIVGTGNGQHRSGGSGPDAIMALGPNETIVGGGGADQMGALGSNVTITGGTGSSVIYGGPKGTLVSGPAPDLLIDTSNDGTVRLTGDGNEVILSGRNNHVVCAPTSHDDLIYANRSASIDPTCIANNARLSSLDQGLTKTRFQLTRTTSTRIHGSGTTGDPFVGPCDNPGPEDCTVSTFAPRALNGLWANEFTRAYKCPTDHPYLIFQNYAPPGTTLEKGVEIRQGHRGSAWAINVYVMNTQGVRAPPGYNPLVPTLAAGTRHGFGNGSATNWSTGYATYQTVLHCTSNANHGYAG